MRKFLITLLATLSLGVGSAFAQDNMMGGTQWVGASAALGLPLGLNLHYGLADLLAPDLDLRFNLAAATFFNGGIALAGGADVLYHLNLEMQNDLPLDVYVGGGLDIGANFGSEIGLAASLAALAGAEYPIDNNLAIFGELRGGLGFSPGISFAGGLRLGVNYYF